MTYTVSSGTLNSSIPYQTPFRPLLISYRGSAMPALRQKRIGKCRKTFEVSGCMWCRQIYAALWAPRRPTSGSPSCSRSFRLARSRFASPRASVRSRRTWDRTRATPGPERHAGWTGPGSGCRSQNTCTSFELLAQPPRQHVYTIVRRHVDVLNELFLTRVARWPSN